MSLKSLGLTVHFLESSEDPPHVVVALHPIEAARLATQRTRSNKAAGYSSFHQVRGR